MPGKSGRVVDPQIREIFGCLGCILKTAEEEDVVFVVGHSVA